MSTQIDPLISQKLRAFALRRRHLIVRRGSYAAAATFLIGMMVVACIDWLFLLPDASRWVLSAAAYLTVIVVAWRSCWRLLVKTPDARALARLFEHAEPGLREDLLSAVELGGAGDAVIFDSPQFRALLQANVASRVERVDVEHLLPARLVRRHAIVAAGIGLTCLAAFLFTGFQFGTLLMRALLPMANFARVSKVKVRILEPSPAELRVPQGDALPLIIELSGHTASKATLETFTPSGGREVVPMTHQSGNRFSATIQVGRENVYYRIRAGDAETAKYRLEAVPRPAVVQFEKSYSYPGYSKLPPKKVTEENGDLVALEGSVVELRLRANQKVREAELRIEVGRKITVQPLVAEGDALAARVSMNASGIYRVHLVGSESGFENKFSPEYEIKAVPDLVPQVELDSPKEDLILPSNEVVDVLGSASDDFALAKVSQAVKINDGPWRDTTLASEPGAKFKIDRRWDLFEQGVKPGDLVTMKLVAVDLKGNRAESRPLQVTVTATGFETRRLQALLGYRELLEAYKSLDGAAASVFKADVEARQQFERLPEGDPQDRQILAPLTAGLEDLTQKNAAAVKLLAAAMRDATPGHESAEFALFGRAVLRANTSFTDSVHRIVDLLTVKPGLPASKELLAGTVNDTARAGQITRPLVENCRVLLTAEEVDVFNENLEVVALEQERLLGLAHQSGSDLEKWAPVGNRLRVVVSELRGLEELLGATVDNAPRGFSDRLRNVQKLLNKRRTVLEAALGGKGGVELLGPTMELSQAMTDTRHLALEIMRDLRPHIGQALRLLDRQTELAYAGFEQLRPEVERYSRDNRLPAETSASLIDGRWTEHFDAVKGRGDIEEQRPEADRYFVNDLRLTSRVLQSLRGRVSGQKPESWAKELQTLQRNFRMLEAAHLVSEVLDGVTHLAAAEHWEIYNPKSRTTNPQDWAWLDERLRMLPAEVGGALDFEERRKLGQDARKILEEAVAQPFTSALQQEMDQRFDVARHPVSAREQAEGLAEFLRQALNLLRQPAIEARQNLERSAPTMAETMKQLAKEADDLRDKSTNQAQQVHDQLPDEAKAEIGQTLSGQQRLNQELEALKDSLRADANQQNIREEKGRARARDADDAVAMLREPPQRATENLEIAAGSDKAATEELALNQAAEQQEKLSQALAQMAGHYDALEKGDPEKTRAALRATEQQNGVKEELDEQYAKAEQMAKLANSSPEEMLAQLEKALPQNPQMRKELSVISQSTLKAAAEMLERASGQERAVAQNVQRQAETEQAQSALQPTSSPAPGNRPATPPENSQAPASAPTAPPPVNQGNPSLAQAAEEQKPIANAAAEVGDEISRAARHESRLENKVAGEQLRQLAEQVQTGARQQVPDAQRALEQARQAAQAKPAVDGANEVLRKSLAQLNAIAAPEKAAESPAPADVPNRAGQQTPTRETAPVASSTTPGSPTRPTPSSPGTSGDQLPAKGAGEKEDKGAELPPASTASAAPASPQEQVWMARTLDALDAALHTAAGSEAQQQAKSGTAPGQNPQNNQNTAQSQAPGTQTQSKSSSSSKSAAQAQSAMNAAAQAAAAAARSTRMDPGGNQPGQPQPGGMQAMSRDGMQASGANGPHGALGTASGKAGDWGKLPKQMAEQLSQGEREGMAGEYRSQVETYYRAIAEKSKKP